MPLTYSEALQGGNIQATLETLAARYPISQTWLLGAVLDENAPAPVVVPGTRKIHIPPHSQMGPGQEALERDCKNGLSRITAHEFAHALMLAVQLDAVGGDFDQLPDYLLADILDWQSRPERERSRHLTEPANEIGHIVTRAIADGLSRDGFGDLAEHGTYASHDNLELFAESMRAYWTHEDSDRPLAPFAAYVGDEVDRRYRA